METTILVEGFQKSVEMHGMRYLFFIGDGDSSVYSQLREKVSYGQMIKKTECKNHVIKNYTSALYKVSIQSVWHKLLLTVEKFLQENKHQRVKALDRPLVVHITYKVHDIINIAYLGDEGGEFNFCNHHYYSGFRYWQTLNYHCMEEKC